MDLEGLILLLIKRINFMCLLGIYGNFEESAKLLNYLHDCFKVIQSYYPHKVGGIIRHFELFVSKKETKEKDEKRIVGLRFASFITLCYFKKEWPNLVQELTTRKISKLKLPETNCFMKIYLLFKSCSELYHEKIIQAYHYYHCNNPKLHSIATVYYFRVTKFCVVNMLYDKKKRKTEFKQLLMYYPFLKKCLITRHKSDFQQTKVNSLC